MPRAGAPAIVLTAERMTNGRIDYSDFEDLALGLGSARDVLSILSTHTGRTTVNRATATT